MIEALADAFMLWDYAQANSDMPAEQDFGDKCQQLRIVDVFGE